MFRLILMLVLMSCEATAQALPPARGLPAQGNLPGQVAPRDQREPIVIAPPPPFYGQGSPRETRCNRIGDTTVCRSN